MTGKTFIFLLLLPFSPIFLNFRPWSYVILPSRRQICEPIFQNKSKIDLVRTASLLIRQVNFLVIPANKFRPQKIIPLVISTSQHPTCHQLLKISINFSSNLLENLRMVDLENLKQLVQNISNNTFVAVERWCQFGSHVVVTISHHNVQHPD